jgi:repressor LexA
LGIGKVLSDLIELKKSNVNEIAKLADISPQTLYSMIRRDSMKADIDVLIKVSKVLGVSVEYFYDMYRKGTLDETHDLNSTFTVSIPEQSLIKKYRALDEHGKKSIDLILDHEFSRIEKSQKQNACAAAIHDVRCRQLPLYELPVSAGTGVFLDSGDYETVNVNGDVPMAANFGVVVSGDSMEPMIHDGDTIWVKQQPYLEEGDIGIFVLNNTGYCKKYFKDRLVSLNSAYPDIVFHEYDDLRIVGKVL